MDYSLSDRFKKEFPDKAPSDVIIMIMYHTELTDFMKKTEYINPRDNPELRIKIESKRIDL